MRWSLGVVLLVSGCFRVEGLDLGELPDLKVPPRLELSHLPQHYLTDGTCDLTIPSSVVATFDTTQNTLTGIPLPTGCVIQGQPEAPDGGTPFDGAVLAVRNLTIADGATLRISGSRIFAIVAGAQIQIDGTINASANLEVAGPGGTGPGVGGVGTTVTNGGGSGGGGGGYGSNGARAASSTGTTPATLGGAGGLMYNTPNLASSLEGGSHGGNGGTVGTTSTCGMGGGGGGGVQLSAAGTLNIASTGRVLANGGGGRGGCTSAGGGGGGSGGGLFLEAVTITLSQDAVVAANGGGGGAGAQSNGTFGDDGENGLAATTPAPGGTVGPGGSAGGAGGAATADAATGLTGARTGGGGGAVGRIVFHTNILSSIGIVSPAARIETF